MSVLVTIVGVFALIGGTVGYFALPYGLSVGIKSMMNLAENGMIYPKYMNPTSALPTSYYLFAITNPKDVLKGGKASFVLKGPYVYLKSEMRDKIMFRDQGQKVAFETRKVLKLDEFNSADLDEKMWLINPVMLTTASMAKSMVADRVPFKHLAEPIIFNALNMALDSFDESLMLYTTPRKMLMGRKIGILETLLSLGIRYGVQPPVSGNFFGLVHGQNLSSDSMEIWTGVGRTRDKFAEVTKFKDKKRMDFWRDEKCNMIEGTNGELYKPFPKKGKPLKIFSGGLCRSIELDPVGDKLVTLESGLKALKYEVSERAYMGVRSNQNNECFCEDSRTFDCQYNGLMSMGPCLSGAPLYLSRANFKNVDPRIRDLVDWQSIVYPNGTGGSSDVLSDEQTLLMDPVTGLVLGCRLTMMALFKVVRQPRLGDAANVQPLSYVPLFAIYEKFDFPSEAAFALKVLQNINQYQGMAMVGTALTGLAMLGLKFMIS